MLAPLEQCKTGHRLGQTALARVTDPLAVRAAPKLVACSASQGALMGMSPKTFRRHWDHAISRLPLPQSCLPNGIQRGGASQLFRTTGSFAEMADQGRWAKERTARAYTWRKDLPGSSEPAAAGSRSWKDGCRQKRDAW